MKFTCCYLDNNKKNYISTIIKTKVNNVIIEIIKKFKDIFREK
jgi:hypothetical protein